MTMLRQIAEAKYPAIVYESKHRILKLLTELEDARKGKSPYRISVARELTKLHESRYAGTPEAVRQELESDPNNLKGEFVVLIRQE